MHDEMAMTLHDELAYLGENLANAVNNILLRRVETKALLKGVQRQGIFLLPFVNFAHHIVGGMKGGLDG